MEPGARILISGAGVAGLTAAIWLGRAGFRPLVVERAPQVRADGFIVSLSSHAYAYAAQLDLIDPIRAVAAGIRESAYYHRSGRSMLELDYQALFRGVDIVQVMRDDLQRVLYTAASDVAEFRFDDSIASIATSDDGAEVRFESGDEARFDVVIGADGLHSVTRDLVWNDSAAASHTLPICSAAYRLPNVLKLVERFENHMEQNRYMCVYSTRSGDLACVFIWHKTPGLIPAPPARRSLLHEAYAGAPAVVQQVLDECPQTGFYMDGLVQIKMDRWSHGPVVLLGDAAHCMTLLSGQGASAAFWGASVLCESLIANPPAVAFRTLENALRPTITRKQPATEKAAAWYIPGSPLRYFLRDTAMTVLPNAFFQRYFTAKYSSA